MAHRKNYYRATAILAAVTAGYLISYPFRNFFPGGLLTSLFGAAMIGGIADWFGITALFRRPLGIPFRTGIIPRSRKKILDSLVNMVENELLTEEIILRKLGRISFSKALIRYMEEDGGTKDTAAVLAGIIRDAARNLDRDELEKLVSKMLSSPELKMDFSAMLARAGRWGIENGYYNTVVDFIIPLASNIISSKQSYLIIKDTASGVMERIEKNSIKEKGGRGLAFKVLFSIPALHQALPDKMAEGMAEDLQKKLAVLKSPKGRPRALLKKKASKYLAAFEKDEKLKAFVNETILGLLKKYDWREPALKALSSEPENSGLERSLENMVGIVFREFSETPSLQESFDNTVKNLLGKVVRENHHRLGQVVRNKLESFTDDDIVELVESRTGDDLQMIRINGSVVGGFIGAVTFLLTYWF